MKKKFTTENITFMSLSLDMDNKIKEWQELSKKLKITGIQYRVLEKSNKLFSSNYKIESIPKYLIFNKNGELLHEKFLPPSDINFQKELLSLIKH